MSHAAINITNFNLEADRLSFDIAGNLPTPAPGPYDDILYFENPNISANPGFALGFFSLASSKNFSGSQAIEDVATAHPTLDYFFIKFTSPLLGNEALNGTITATWGSNVFDPSELPSNLNAYWGDRSALGGTFLGTVSTVPEPNAYAALAGLAALSLVASRRHV